jgi:hypothetical protein
MIIIIGAKSIYALILLYYLMPDTRTRPDHSRIVSIVPVSQLLLLYTIPLISCLQCRSMQIEFWCIATVVVNPN